MDDLSKYLWSQACAAHKLNSCARDHPQHADVLNVFRQLKQEINQQMYPTQNQKSANSFNSAAWEQACQEVAGRVRVFKTDAEHPQVLQRYRELVPRPQSNNKPADLANDVAAQLKTTGTPMTSIPTPSLATTAPHPFALNIPKKR